MSWKRTILLLVLLVLLIIVYNQKILWKPSVEEPDSYRVKSKSAFILELPERHVITRIKLSRGNDKNSEMTLEKKGDHKWWIAHPVEYPAESLIADGFVSLLKLSGRIRELSFEGLAESEFGFDQPRLKICMSTSPEGAERCLAIGSQGAIVKGAYAKWNDEQKFFIVNENFLAAFDKSLYALRKKRVFDFSDESEIQVIRIRDQSNEYKIKRDGKSWFLIEPAEMMIGSDPVSKFLQDLNVLYIKEFIDDMKWRAEEYGLTRPVCIVRLVFKDRSKKTLIVGKEAPGRDAYYAKMEDLDQVFLLSYSKFNEIQEVFKSLVK
ncbi:MAG: hypothetical protein A3G33_06330 [Omnitrophica bacterium RIFCSPLOWO2_12_FULL_44_17]|uniref:DUF4340 domain-containing protein n=1 Tax=Candidatus Danuiimicrobium aquiferis TaxID=1801832 RepID=A0A1G1L1I3_9BACT|nr:MAG: hypothetical protein A3B72_01695 [Omnitrophica bacterium RIFCSPHIGHO2_02_FULL_45_28]OGW89944.1 MAG: hypothetical protein A3E74_03160 [Omnitrophica bacterium RIFCSPHIGHO2_12_FULL_44_12]OGW98994.1 MAG: hypothetical protein A3G33_06330 [Omnitrophica bacterium RIFCSPLOWO2_12_FULL_44_17]OGX04173.1 MAG: hypothetical protein A3J12_03265 [Omnitrophica bacterium RIFCSPLOWO2_02_FULL_44_11]